MKTEELTAKLRLAILSADYVPGQRLVEADLEERFGAGRRAIRETLAVLDHEGLVVRRSNVGARVREISVDEALKSAEIRLLVESLCVRRAAQRIDAEGIARLRTQGEALSRAAEAGDVPRYSELSTALVRAWVDLADHSVARDTLERLRQVNVRHNFRVTSRPGWLKEALPRRLAILEAICSGDAGRAEAALRAHSEAVMDELRQIQG